MTKPSAILLLAAAMATSAASAYQPSHYAASSALSEGKWVKVKATGSGIRQITYDQLRQWGFSSPENVTVFGYSALEAANHSFPADFPDDIVQTASMHTADGRVLFYAEADAKITVNAVRSATITRNFHDSCAYYFITDNAPRKEIASVAVTASASRTFDSHWHADFIEREVQNVGATGVYFHGRRLGQGDSENFAFRLRDYSTSTTLGTGLQGYFRYDYAMKASVKSSMTVTYPSDLTVSSIRNNTCTSLSNSSRYYNSSYGDARFTPASGSTITDYVMNVNIAVPAGLSPEYCAVDKAFVLYPRFNRLNDDEESLRMNFLAGTYLATGQHFTVSGADRDAEIWDITNPLAITRHDTRYDASSRTVTAAFKSGLSCTLIAFNPSHTMPGVEFDSDVVAQNIHAAETPEMAIITTRTMQPYAQEYADMRRRTDGLEATVFVQDDIFNEFSSGVRHPAAYRRMAKMFYDRDPLRFRHILLYGCSTWDSRFITVPKSDMLLCFPAENTGVTNDLNSCYTADLYFGMLSDDFDINRIEYLPTEVNVGRLTPSESSKAQAYTRKVEKYLTSRPDPATYMRALMLSDDGDGNKHLIQSEEAIATLQSYNPDIAAIRAHNLLYPWENGVAVEARSLITRSLTRGQGYFSYSGHGNATYICAQRLWNTKLAESTKYSVPGFAMMSTCDTYPFIHLSNSIAEGMIFNPEGGMIGIVASSGPVFLEYNQATNLSVAREYANASPGTTFGDLFTKARNRIAPTLDTYRAINAISYNFCGDPSIAVPVPEYRLVLDTVDDMPATSEVNVAPLRTVRITAHVADAAGNAVTDFNGTGLLELYDGPSILSTTVKDGSNDTSMTVPVEESILLEKALSVLNGRVEASFNIPAPGVEGALNRLTLSASDTSTGKAAAGSSKVIKVGKYDSALAAGLDTSAPVIEQFYINSPDFVSGGLTTADFTVTAIVDPSPTGVNMSTRIIGAAPSLVLDGTTAYPDFAYTATYLPDGRIRFDLPVNSVADGRHTLRLSLANNAGTRTSASLDFQCVATTTGVTLSTDLEVARESVEFDLNHNFSDNPTARLVILDHEGNTVLSRENVSFPFVWNLKDSKGADVPDGRYTAFSTFRKDQIYTHTPKTEIVVIR